MGVKQPLGRSEVQAVIKALVEQARRCRDYCQANFPFYSAEGLDAQTPLGVLIRLFASEVEDVLTIFGRTEIERPTPTHWLAILEDESVGLVSEVGSTHSSGLKRVTVPKD